MTLLIIALTAFVDYNVEYGLNFTYDDNVWDYSAQDLNDFVHRVRPYRFPFETYDDLVTRHDARLTFRSRTIMNRTSTLNFQAVAYGHLVNREKDWQALSAGLRQSFGNSALKVDYLFIPRYLIKYYPDPATAEYSQCAFAEHFLAFKASVLAWKPCAVHFKAGREWDNYVPGFRVYDTRAWRFGAELDLSLGRFYEPSVAYEYKDAASRGPYPDLSYRQHSGSVGNRFNLRIPRLTRLDLGYRLAYRSYTTDLPPDQDTPHAGRIDLTHRLAGALDLPVLGFLSVQIQCEYEFRRASSPNFPGIGAVKDYDKRLASAGLSFRY